MAKKFYTGIDLASQRGVNAGDPQNPGDLVNKSYVDNLLAGLRWKEPVVAATTGNITLSGPQTVDGVALTAGMRALVKDQTDGTENGIYVVASGAWTRAADADSTAELDSATVMVQQGTANGDQAFTQTADAPAPGTDSITFAQFGGGGASYTADGDGISLSGTTFSLELDPSGSGLSKGAAGLKLASTVAGDGLTYNSGVLAVGGGSGITVSADGIAVDTSVVVTTPSTVVRKYAANVGAMTAGTPITINHALNTTDVTVAVKEVSSGALVEMDVVVSDANNITLTTAAGFAADTFRVVVHG